MLGFGFKLSENELTILQVFKGKKEVGFPLGSMNVETTKRTLVSLKKKCLITGNGPYKLSRLGVRILDSLNKEQQSDNN